MGVDISAKVILGMHYKDLPEEILEEVDEMLNSGEGLDYASPHYDSPMHKWIVGIEVNLNCFADDAPEVIQKAREFLPDCFQGLIVSLHVTQHVY